jgi:membrane protease YdiL (CAAX protease family)
VKASEPTSEPAPPEYPGLGVSVLVVLVLFQPFSSGLMDALEWVFGSDPDYNWALVRVYFAVVFALVCHHLLSTRDLAGYLGLRRASWRAYAWALGGFFGMQCVVLVCIGMVYLTLTQFDIHSRHLSGPDFSRESWSYSLFSGVIIAPVTEELVFRGIVLQGLLERYSARFSIIVSAMMFGIWHGNTHQLIGATIVGLCLGWVFSKTRSLWAVIGLHASHNAWVDFRAYFFQQSRSSEPSNPLANAPWYEVCLGLLIVGLIGLAGLWICRHCFRKFNETCAAADLLDETFEDGVLKLSDFKARRPAAAVRSGQMV